MSIYKMVRRQSMSTSIVPVFKRPSRPSTSAVTLTSSPTNIDWQAQIDRAARFGHSFQRIPLFPPDASMPIQTKLIVGPASDKYEQEADRVARQVMSMETIPVQRQLVQSEGEEEELQTKPLTTSITPLVQREKMTEDEGQHEHFFRQQTIIKGGATKPSIENAIEQNRSGGQSLPVNIRTRMERAFGADFTAVKVHTDAESDRLNRKLYSRAFTTGPDLFFKRGEYSPASRSGQELIAHELTHVAQQIGSGLRITRQAKGVIQRQLEGEDIETFTRWLAQEVKDLSLNNFQRGKILAECIQEARSVEEARLLAIDKTARIKSLTRRGPLENKRARQESEASTDQQIALLEELIAELEQYNTELGSALVPAMASLSQVLFRTYPDENQLYVMLGNSPAPLMAYIEASHMKVDMFNMPLGGLSSPSAPEATALGEQSDEPLSEAATKEAYEKQRRGYHEKWGQKYKTPLTNYFDKVLLPKLKLGRDIVLIDFADTGLSLVVIADFVEKYLAEKQIPLQVKLFAFAEKAPKEESFLMQSGHELAVASPIGKMEKIFTKLTKDKAYKKVKFLIQYASLDIADLVKSEDPVKLLVAKPEYYLRMLSLIKKQLASSKE